MKCNQSRPGFELESPCSFPTTITTTPRAPLQGDTLAPYLLIICLDYVLRTSIDKIRENGFELTKKRSITDADYADDIALLANAPNQAETLLHNLEQAAAGIGLHVNAHKTEHMSYNQTGARCVMVIVVGIGHSDTSSNPGPN